MTDTTITREAIQERVFAALVEFGADEDAIGPRATWEELDVDSLDLVEFAQIIEDEYGVELREADIEQMTTVDDAVTMVTARIA
ncbi:MAG: phosphopantetheine-binding protein [Solirubrobacterales bacterium]